MGHDHIFDKDSFVENIKIYHFCNLPVHSVLHTFEHPSTPYLINPGWIFLGLGEHVDSLRLCHTYGSLMATYWFCRGTRAGEYFQGFFFPRLEVAPCVSSSIQPYVWTSFETEPSWWHVWSLFVSMWVHFKPWNIYWQELFAHLTINQKINIYI
jgi:hypothetical protein